MLLAFLITSCAASFGRRGGLPRESIERLPPNVAEAYGVFAHKCSRCHTLARALGAPIYDLSHWQAYVTRMRRQSGSGISEADGEKILVFLEYYAAEKKKLRDGQPSALLDPSSSDTSTPETSNVHEGSTP